MGDDINSNAHIDAQFKVFVDYFERMRKEATPENYQRMLQDLHDDIEMRLKAIGIDYGKKNWWEKLFSR